MKFNAELAEQIIRRIAKGEPLRAICRDEGMPDWSSVYDWMDARPELAARIAKARELGYDAIAEEALEIANTPVMGEETETGPQGVKTKRADMLGHRKLQVWTRLQLLAKWAPKKYGERTELHHTGEADWSALGAAKQRSVAPAATPATPAAKGRKKIDDLL